MQISGTQRCRRSAWLLDHIVRTLSSADCSIIIASMLEHEVRDAPDVDTSYRHRLDEGIMETSRHRSPSRGNSYHHFAWRRDCRREREPGIPRRGMRLVQEQSRVS